MLRSLYTAATGVKGHQTYLDVTGNNIANVNTVGFKRDVIQFADMISQIIISEAGPVSPPGGVNPAPVGLGVSVASISPCFVQGALQSTEIPTDMAIQGEGFFVVHNGQKELYTRAGNFSLDRDGNLVMQGNGYLVQGYKYDEANRQDALSDIVIPIGDVMPQRATQAAVFRCNLDAGAAARIADVENVPTGAGKVARPFDYSDSTDVSASASSTASQASIDAFGASVTGSYDWYDSFSVYDAEGNPHTMTVMFRHVFDRPADTVSVPPVPAESEWDWYAYYTDANGTAVPSYGSGAGTIVFGDDGLIKRTYTFDPANNWGVAERDAALSGGGPTGLVEANFGAPGEPIALDFLGGEYAAAMGVPYKGAIDGVTGFGSPSTTKLKWQDGYSQGVLNYWSISDSGVVTGAYTNGQSRSIAQVALAMFMNPQGLVKVGKTCFEESSNSGPVKIMAPGENGAGTIKGASVEMSNVDLSEEFVNLIRSQRGLQANTRAITTSDQMLETLINLKR
ncbi:MAG: flagellar hook protein FlgE [Synergistaceae bacterium]|jgi:flagellar hook protein FlgE|nr:flagellar hook protein FlgE [Synergistaceae bacterium]